MKYLKWVIKSLFFSLLLIFATNLIGIYFNINIPLNFWTILITGIFRIPGIIILIIFFLL